MKRPDSWLPWDIARRDFKAEWCKRERLEDCSDLGERAIVFEDEWFKRRTVALAALESPNINPTRYLDLSYDQLLSMEMPPELVSAPDLRGADLRGAFLTGANLMGARLQGAKGDHAWFEQAALAFAKLHGAGLRGAQLQSANLTRAQMPDADLVLTQLQNATLTAGNLERANLFRADLEGANLQFAEMQGARLINAKMWGATLIGAEMQGVDLSSAQMQGVDLSLAHMQGVVLAGAQMQDSKLNFSLLTGATNNLNVLYETNLSAASNQGGALRYVDLRAIDFDGGTDFRNAFIDGSVIVDEAFREQMGSPCQWWPEPLPDVEFFGRWRGWVESSPGTVWGSLEYLMADGVDHRFPAPLWEALAPVQWQNVPAIPPPAGCEWMIVPPVIVPITVVEEQPN